MRVLAIDPGPERSALVYLEEGSVESVNEVKNFDIVEYPQTIMAHGLMTGHVVVIESMTPFGQPISQGTMETLIWIGEFRRHFSFFGARVVLLPRIEVKKHLLGQVKGGDTQIRSVLGDRYGGVGGWRAAKGTKKNPGPLYGLTGSHLLAALAVGVTFLDQQKETV